jgi:DNA-binding transcriptional regulator YiaG
MSCNLSYWNVRVEERKRERRMRKAARALAKRGSTATFRAEVAKLLGTKRQTITNWFAGRQQPTGEQALVVLQFLKHRRRKS